ncbi:hypothetical protein ACFVIM_19590 [Streptomyces sp. NPDC057638]
MGLGHRQRGREHASVQAALANYHQLQAEFLSMMSQVRKGTL